VQLALWAVSLSLHLIALPFCILFWTWTYLTVDPTANVPKDRPEEDASTASRWGRDGHLQLKDVSIHYVEAGDKRNQLILCLHGFPEFWFSWRHQLKEFASTHWVVAVDLRGYNQSDKPSGREQYHMDHLVEDVRQILAALGREECVLMAHDWGGGIAWQVVIRYPQLIRRFIVLDCPHPAAFQDTIASDYTQILKSWYMVFFQLPALPEMELTLLNGALFRLAFHRRRSASITDEETRAYLDVYRHPSDLKGPINYYRNILDMVDEPPRHVIKVPTLIIWGQEDKYLKPDLAHLSAKFVEDCTVHIIPGASHFVQQDVPDVVNKKIRQFLAAPPQE
jgi:pimeloyl-ACP methyl ester carboxylesterase